MKIKLILTAILLCIVFVSFSQNDGSFEFKPGQKLKRQHGLQDPFLKSDGKRVASEKEWAKQRSYKKPMPALWEESTRVPLLFSFPGMKAKGKKSSRPVSLLDIYPTLLSLSDLLPNPVLEGNDLTSLLNDPNMEWPQPVLSVWRYKNYAVRSERYRCTQYRDGTEELHDHQTDPGEHISLADNPKYGAVLNNYRQRLPKQEALPAGTDEWPGDKYEEIIEGWKVNGITQWLN